MATAAPGLRVKRLQDQVFTPGAQVSVQTSGLVAPGRAIYGVLLRLDLDITQPGAGQVAQLGAVMHQLIARIAIGRRINLSGLALHVLNWMMWGRSTNMPAGMPATAGGVFSRAIEWWIPYYDRSARSPKDGVVPSELWTDSIDITFGTTAIFAATVPTLGNGVLRTYVYHGPAGSVPGRRVTVPASQQLFSEGFNNLAPLITKAGIWTHAAFFREAPNDAGGITSAQVSALTSYIDGQPVLENVRAQDVASIFNGVMSEGTSFQVESQTVPVGGEFLQDLPGPAAAAGQAVTADFLPVLVPPYAYRLSELPEAHASFSALMAGTLGAYTAVYRIIEPRSDMAVAAASARLGIDSGQGYIKADGKPAPGRLGRFLPVDVRGLAK
jgi:hypothetical protein